MCVGLGEVRRRVGLELGVTRPGVGRWMWIWRPGVGRKACVWWWVARKTQRHARSTWQQHTTGHAMHIASTMFTTHTHTRGVHSRPHTTRSAVHGVDVDHTNQPTNQPTQEAAPSTCRTWSRWRVGDAARNKLDPRTCSACSRGTNLRQTPPQVSMSGHYTTRHSKCMCACVHVCGTAGAKPASPWYCARLRTGGVPKWTER